MPFDDDAKEHLLSNKSRLLEIESSLAGLARQIEIGAVDITPEIIERFCTSLREKLLEKDTQFAKAYLNLLVDEITVDGDQVYMKGRNAVLIDAMNKTKVGLHKGVPTSGGGWLPELDGSGQWNEGFEI